MLASSHLPDDKIAMLLEQADADLPGHFAEHLSSCEHCQQRLELQAAEKADWRAVKDCLAEDSPNDADFSVTSSFERFDWRRSCDDAMCRQLLEAPSHPEMLGRLGRYEVERVIGTGGMGIVFRAHDTELHRPVAIKMLAPHLSGSDSARSRFAREARAAAAIVNDHVVPIHNVETDHARPYLVMQYIAGDSLQARLDREGTLELSEILRIGMQVAKGLAAAHSQGLIHRDVKPSNILLDENVSRALLTDFGLARTQDDACLTRSGFHPGTPHYMSPEQVRGEDLDGRSDLFGLGCVLYALCTSHPPFRAESGYAVMRRITDETPRSICQQNSDFPVWLERVVLRLLEKDKAKRYQSATEVADLLEQCLAHVQKPNLNNLPLIEDLNSKDQSLPRKRHMSGLIVGIAILFIVLVGVPILQSLKTLQTVLPLNVVILEDVTPSSTATPAELDADARQAMSTHQNRLAWTNRFKFDSIRRSTHKEVGRVEERSTMASDGKRFVHRQENLKLDQPADQVGRSLTSFAYYTGDSFMGGTCLTGQPMKTGGYSGQNAEEHAWGMCERTSMMLEGYRAGNAGQTILELLLKSKALDVKKDKIGEVDCFRIKNRDEWGTHVAWIEAKGKNRLLQWESRKERGNKFTRSRQGEHRDTSSYESSGVRVTGIEYREIDGTPIAIRGTYVCFDTPNGGQESVSSMEMERLNFDLQPDFSNDSIFDPLYAEEARITDLDGTDPDKHFWWRNGQLVASDPVNSNQQSTSNIPQSSKGNSEIQIKDQSVYQLKPGESLRWIPSSLTLERPVGAHMNSSGYLFEQADQTIRLKTQSSGEQLGLSHLLHILTGIYPCELSGSETDWFTQIPGDFVVRKGAAQQDLFEDLNRVFRDDLKNGLSLQPIQVNRNVLKVKGQLKLKPIGITWKQPSDKAIVLYGKSRTGLYTFTEGKFDDVLKALGSRTGMSVLNNLTQTPSGYFGWQVYSDDMEHPQKFHPNDDIECVELVIEHFREQTGLDVETEIQPVQLIQLTRFGAVANANAQVGEFPSTKSPIASKKISVRGLVLKPDGSPADGAIVRVAAPVFGDMRRMLGKDFESTITEAVTDGLGKFEISVDSEPYGNFPTKGTRWEGFWKKSVICATMPGFAGQFKRYEEIEGLDSVVLGLVEDTPIRGRVIDLEGRPVSGVAIQLKGILASSNETLDAWLSAAQTGESDWQAEKEIPRQIETRLLGVPKSVTTDRDGSFSIKGIGRERCLPLQVHGNGIAFEEFKVATRSMNPLTRKESGQSDTQESIYGVEFTYVGQPSRPVHGTVTDAKTGQPLAGVDVGVETISGKTTSGRWLLPTKSDALGQFRIEGMPKGIGNRLMLIPSDDQPYLMREIDVIDSEGMGPVAMDIGLHRGIWIEGKVVDKKSREPVAGVRLHYLPFLTNKFANELPEFDLVTVDGQQDRYQTDLNGNYRIVGLPGPAVVGVESLHKPYLSGIGYNALTVPKDPNGSLTYRNPFSPRPTYPNSMSEIDPKPDAERVQLDFELFPCQTIQVSAVDESSDWLTGGVLIHGMAKVIQRIKIESAPVELNNIAPNESREILVHHEKRGIGIVHQLTAADIAEGKLHLTARPCASVSGRLVDNGEPLAGAIVTPSIAPTSDYSQSLASVATDKNGYFKAVLLPGCKYILRMEGKPFQYARFNTEIDISPGENFELGTLTLSMNDRTFKQTRDSN